MEGRGGDFAGAAAPQGRYYGDDQSDGSSGGVELSLRLRTGSSPPAAEQQHDATAMRSMTIFYNGRVCAVDVTEIQAREIISMANQEILAHQRQQREDKHVQDRVTTTGGQVSRPTAAALSPVTTDQAAGLSMKRSLQRFLQKREARRAEAVPAAAGGRPTRWDDTDS